MTCPSLERLGAWLVDSVRDDESNRLEEHLFSCERCASRAERMEALVDRLRAALPPVLTPERRRKLEAAFANIPAAPVSPAGTARLEFRRGVEIAFWVLKHDLDGVERVDCQFVQLDGSPLLTLPDVPFDAERREVVLACSVHYRNLGPPDFLAQLTTVHRTGKADTTDYRLNHVFFDE